MRAVVEDYEDVSLSELIQKEKDKTVKFLKQTLKDFYSETEKNDTCDVHLTTSKDQFSSVVFSDPVVLKVKNNKKLTIEREDYNKYNGILNYKNNFDLMLKFGSTGLKRIVIEDENENNKKFVEKLSNGKDIVAMFLKKDELKYVDEGVKLLKLTEFKYSNDITEYYFSEYYYLDDYCLTFYQTDFDNVFFTFKINENEFNDTKNSELEGLILYKNLKFRYSKKAKRIIHCCVDYVICYPKGLNDLNGPILLMRSEHYLKLRTEIVKQKIVHLKSKGKDLNIFVNTASLM